MIKFEKVSRFKNVNFNLPVRKTANSAGYDFEVAEDIMVPRLSFIQNKQFQSVQIASKQPGLKDVARVTKSAAARPTLVSTGVKCYLDPGTYLELSVRSSTPLKYMLVLANGVGIIDADYADNPDNEGEIFFQILNLGPTDVYLKKGDIIGQGIIKRFEITDDDAAAGEREGGFGSTTKGE